MKNETVNEITSIVLLKDYHTFEAGHPLEYLNEKSMVEALAEICQALEFTRIFSTHVRLRLEPVLSIEFEKIDTNKVMSVVIGVAKSLTQQKLTPKFLKDKADDDMLTTIDKQFADAGMNLNLQGIFSMPEEHRAFMLEFIRFWGLYFDSSNPQNNATLSVQNRAILPQNN